MRIAIHDGDCGITRFPNLALMKLSAWHRAAGDSVEWYSALDTYDRVYSSSVFTFSAKDPYLPPDAVRGGTGYGLYDNLPDGVNSMRPDYTLYPDFPSALGFCTRGCIRRCEWCVVPRKEGGIRHEADIADITGDRKSVVMMDNNFLAWEGHREQLGWCAKSRVRIDFNQGLDARLVNDLNAPLLAACSWMGCIRFSCDTVRMVPVVRRAVAKLRRNGYRGAFFCYVLVRDVGDALDVTESLRVMGVDPFAQAFMDFTGEDERTEEQKRFCRWVNMKAVWKTVAWEDYR